MRYVALLRGVNVGGTGMVKMAELRRVFESAGMASVSTYINSGNVIFTSDMRDPRRLTVLLEEAMQRHFGFEVGLLLRDAFQLRAVVEAIPAHWTNDQSMRCDVFFLWPAVVWRVDRENLTKSGMLKLMGTPLYKKMTVRNCNTARKLLALVEAAGAAEPAEA